MPFPGSRDLDPKVGAQLVWGEAGGGGCHPSMIHSTHMNNIYHPSPASPRKHAGPDAGAGPELDAAVGTRSVNPKLRSKTQMWSL